MAASWKRILQKIDDWRWLLPKEYRAGMRVPGLIFASEEMLGVIGQDQALEQVANVAFLPGIVNYSMAMPDIHWGYGFPIGGVAAVRMRDGVVSPRRVRGQAKSRAGGRAASRHARLREPLPGGGGHRPDTGPGHRAGDGHLRS